MHIVSNIRVLALSGLVSALVLSAVATAARSEDDGWQADLRKQLAAEHECELNYLTDARTIELLGKQSISARAHCMDKRAFDVTRSGDETTFEVKSCSIVAC